MKKCFTELCGFFGIKPCTGKNIQVHGFFMFRKMRCDGTRFYKLDERVSASDRVVMTEVGDERSSKPFHTDYIVTEFRDE
jgi:hypothetical protein